VYVVSDAGLARYTPHIVVDNRGDERDENGTCISSPYAISLSRHNVVPIPVSDGAGAGEYTCRAHDKNIYPLTYMLAPGNHVSKQAV
jgi:hypothetical protein